MRCTHCLLRSCVTALSLAALSGPAKAGWNCTVGAVCKPICRSATAHMYDHRSDIPAGRWHLRRQSPMTRRSACPGSQRAGASRTRPLGGSWGQSRCGQPGPLAGFRCLGGLSPLPALRKRFKLHLQTSLESRRELTCGLMQSTSELTGMAGT